MLVLGYFVFIIKSLDDLRLFFKPHSVLSITEPLDARGVAVSWLYKVIKDLDFVSICISDKAAAGQEGEGGDASNQAEDNKDSNKSQQS